MKIGYSIFLFSVIKTNKRSSNGTKIYTRNCLIENGFIQNFFLFLENHREIVIDGKVLKSGPDVPFTVAGENPKILNIQRKPDFKFVSIDVKTSAEFIRKANSTEGGKWRIVSCHWNMDSNGDAIKILLLSDVMEKKFLNFSARGMSYSNYLRENLSKQDGHDFLL